MFIAALRRRPYRRDLMWIAATFPVGMLVGEATLGALTVKHKLAPGYVMAHFGLAMIVMIFSVLLVWRSREPPASRETTRCARRPRRLGTGAARRVRLRRNGRYGAGPPEARKDSRSAVSHSRAPTRCGGGARARPRRLALGILAGDVGRDALDGGRPRGDAADDGAGGPARRAGPRSAIQWDERLPAGLVFVHVALAALTWLAILWVACCARAPSFARAPKPEQAAAGAS